MPGVINFGLISARGGSGCSSRSSNFAKNRHAGCCATGARQPAAAAAAADKNPIAPVFASRKGQSRSSWCPALPSPPAAAATAAVAAVPPSAAHLASLLTPVQSPLASTTDSSSSYVLRALNVAAPGKSWGWDSRAHTLRNERFRE